MVFLKPRLWWFLAKKQLFLGPWNQVTKKKYHQNDEKSVKPLRFQRIGITCNLKPLLVSQKLSGFRFAKGNPILMIETGTSENCWQQPSAILRRVCFSVMSQNYPNKMEKLMKCAQNGSVKDVLQAHNLA